MTTAIAVDGLLLAYERLYHDGPPGYIAPVFALARLASAPAYLVDCLLVAHLWWALFIGWLGGLFGRFVYLRRMAESNR